jgi:cobalt-zinc-cadmium efflux system protein
VTVLIAAGVIAFTGWTRADAVASVLIVPRTWSLLRETVDVPMEATPKDVDLVAVRADILDVPHVRDVHDLHASSVASDLPVPTSHVVVDDASFHDGHLPAVLDKLQECLAGHFDVKHSAFQLEPSAHGAHEHAVGV